MSWQHNFLNLLTLSRIPLVLGVVYFLIQDNHFPAFILFLLAVLTDWLDGAFARKFDLETVRGEKFLEPLADALLVFVPLLGLVYIGVLSLNLFLFYCLIGFLSQIAKLRSKRYYSKIHFFQICYLFSAQIAVALWLAEQTSRGWAITVLVIYLLAGYLKKTRVKSFIAYLEK